MRIGTAARLWEGLEPTAAEYRAFRGFLERQSQAMGSEMELCYVPFSMADGLRASLDDPPATMLVLPNGWVKVAAALPHICADLRRNTLAEAWDLYRAAWRDDAVLTTIRRAVENESSHAEANRWHWLQIAQV